MESQAPDVDGVTRFSVPRGRAMPEVGEFVALRLVRADGYDFEGVVAAK